ncbi:uncharacterized protein LOC112349918 isoform X1 [Selaginella moellendorffii]|uniref:uncharacterized protein LOC112349918 isoform X1 n=1 Tax=Selaginella moellendorffii TaxID=88036 RepID=UPI000D1C3CFE|nr:uncharacterized protein LOC112349918 isoform X1 [Selaginella moellendorffii]XP_024540943.1 uncharacterized protein LOC112349918 isoform X1 [Selaginella moellendorffii]|eukprot:XP_024540942.1 uncharacterized protein LOC112349918 isoform X1 [Selaginella moellendorffii]
MRQPVLLKSNDFRWNFPKEIVVAYPIHPSQHLPGERNAFLRSLEYCGLRSSEYADHGFMLRDHLPPRRISPVKEIILVNLLKVISPDLPLAFALSRGWTTKQKLASRKRPAKILEVSDCELKKAEEQKSSETVENTKQHSDISKPPNLSTSLEIGPRLGN